MTLRFLIGPAGSGKTAWCLRDVRRHARAEPGGAPLVLIVPEQASHQTEHALLEDGFSGTTRAHVFSFARLAQWVFSLGPGAALPRLGDVHRRVLVTSLIARLRNDGAPGSIFSVRSIEQCAAEFLAEIKQYRLSADELDQLAAAALAGDARLARKLADLARLARAYDERLRGRFEDPEDTLASLRDRVAGLPELQGARLYIDSFHGFTPVELEVLRGLLRRAHEVNVALLLDRPRYEALRAGAEPSEASRTFPTEETFLELLALARDESIPIAPAIFFPEAGAPPRFRHSDLATLERRFLTFDRGVPAPSSPPSHPSPVSLLVARDTREEARLAIEQLLDWRRAQGWRWSEMAIITRQLGNYAQPLDEFLRAFGIPFFLDRHEPLDTHPVIQGTLAALEAVLHDFTSRAILDFAKSGLFDWERDAVARLEQHVQTWPVPTAQWLGKEPWKAPVQRSPFEDHDEAEADPASVAAMADIDATRRRVLDPLLEFKRTLFASSGGSGEPAFAIPSAIAAICNLIAAGIPSPDAATEAVLQEVSALFDALVQSAGDERFDAESLLDLLRETLGKLTLPRVPPALDQVIAGQVDRTRLPEVKGVVLLGFSEGHFPLPTTNATLLTDRERDYLHEIANDGRGREVRASARRLFLREGFHALIALTRASHAVTITRPLGSAEGEALSPSPYWQEVLRILPDVRPATAPALLTRERIRTPAEAGAYICREFFKGHQHGSAVPSALASMLAAELPELLAAANRQPLLSVLHTASLRNDARLYPVLAREFIGDSLRTSVSALESFAKCPFQHFMRTAMVPSAAPGPGVTPADVGNLAHATLRELSLRLREEDRGFGDIGLQEVPALTATAFAAPLARLRKSGLFNSRGEQAMAEFLLQQLQATVAFLADAGRRLNARLLATEVGFGPRRELAPPQLAAPLSNGESLPIVLRGQIDRIDAWRDAQGREWLAVLDYKLTERKLDWSAAADGSALQLAGYLLVLEQNGAEMLGIQPSALPLAGAFYVPILGRRDKLRMLRGIAPVEAFGSLDLGAHDSGLPALLPSGTGGPHETPSRGDVIPDAQFQRLTARAREVIARHARAIAEGHVAVRPSNLRRATPCANCDYRDACRLDYTMNAQRHIPALKQADAIARWLGEP